MKKFVVSVFSLIAASSSLWAGPYTDGTVGTAADSTSVVEWANQVVNLTRGPGRYPGAQRRDGNLRRRR